MTLFWKLLAIGERVTDNQPAMHLYQKFGFVTEGTLRSFAFRGGAYVDVYSMARIRQDAA